MKDSEGVDGIRLRPSCTCLRGWISAVYGGSMYCNITKNGQGTGGMRMYE